MDMRQIRLLLIVVGLVVASLVAGCNTAPGSKALSAEATASENGEVNAADICTKCGQIKGSDLCCKPGQELCPKCGLAKGSPGCCKIE